MENKTTNKTAKQPLTSVKNNPTIQSKHLAQNKSKAILKNSKSPIANASKKTVTSSSTEKKAVHKPTLVAVKTEPKPPMKVTKTISPKSLKKSVKLANNKLISSPTKKSSKINNSEKVNKTNPKLATKEKAKSEASKNHTKTSAKSGERDFAFEKFGQNVFGEVSKIFEHQLSYWQESMELFKKISDKWSTGLPGIKSSDSHAPSDDQAHLQSDKRFQHKAWNEQPFFHFLKEYYLLNSNYMKTAIKKISEGVDDKKVKHQLNFMAQQWLDAFAPTNFLFTNPEVYELAVQTRGESLWNGFQHFVQDLEHDTGMLHTKITDLSAFQVGKNLAFTPGKVVFKNDLIELIFYAPKTKHVYQKPLLIVPPWINKFYILDLQPHNSLVNFLLEKGHSVFLISWVNPNKNHANKEFSNYLLEGPLAAVEFIRKHIGEIPLNILGYCIGGTLLGSFLSYLAAKNKNYIASATFLATLFDFSDPGDLGVFIDDSQLKMLEQHMHKKGYLEGSVMSATFNSLRANDLIWNYFVNNYLKGQKPPAFDLLFWNADSTNMPAKVHHTYLHDMYLHNLLVVPNGMTLGGVGIDLRKVNLPSYFVSTREDHIAPWTACYRSMMNMSGDRKFVLAGSGHVAGIINPPTKEKYGYWVNPKLMGDSEDWFKNAEKHLGSWWPNWAEWLKQQSGQQILATDVQALFKENIAPAPGEYVQAKSSKHIPKDFENYFIEKMKWFSEKTIEQITKKSNTLFKLG